MHVLSFLNLLAVGVALDTSSRGGGGGGVIPSQCFGRPPTRTAEKIVGGDPGIPCIQIIFSCGWK